MTVLVFVLVAILIVIVLLAPGLLVFLLALGELRVKISGISTYETDCTNWGRENFWPVVAIEGAKMGQKSEPEKEPTELETTVDQARIRGLGTAFCVFVSGLSSR
jgi:hypothetical protein